MIYFIQDSLTYRIKIGFTSKDDVLARLAELQTGNSSLLYLLASRTGTQQTEADLHEQFSHLRQQGEWFNPGPELIQYIVGCSAVEMARQAASEAAMKLVEQSFPETKTEAMNCLGKKIGLPIGTTVRCPHLGLGQVAEIHRLTTTKETSVFVIFPGREGKKLRIEYTLSQCRELVQHAPEQGIDVAGLNGVTPAQNAASARRTVRFG